MKKNIKKKTAPSFEQNTFTFRISLSFDKCSTFHALVQIFVHGNLPCYTWFYFSIKIHLAKITFLFRVLLWYLLKMLLFCIGSISRCCFLVPLLRCCSSVQPEYSVILWLFLRWSVVPPMFRCSVAVPPVFLASLFWCYWFFSIFLDSTKLKIVCKKVTTSFKRCVSIIL